MTTWDIFGNEIYLRNVASNYVNYVAVPLIPLERLSYFYSFVYALDSRIPRRSVIFNESFMKWNDNAIPWRACMRKSNQSILGR